MDHLLLFGMTGSGKSFFGRLLSQRLHIPLIETDRLIEQKAGKSCRELFKEDERKFRKIEKATILELKPEADKRSIIATGGGVILDKQVVEHLLALGRAVFLDVPLPCLKERGAERLIDIEKEWIKRAPLYAALPAICLPVTTVEETLRQLEFVFYA